MKTTLSLNHRKADTGKWNSSGNPACIFHRITALVLIGCLLGTMSPVPLMAQQQSPREVAKIEPLAIAPDRPLSLPPAGPQPDAKLLAAQEAMLTKAAATTGALAPRPLEPRQPQQQLPVFPKFSDPPTDAEIAMIQLFDSPPVPFGAEKPGENAAFVRALEIGREAGWKRGGLAVFEEYLSGHPGSRWEVSLQREIARIRLRDGFFTRATAAMERAWAAARSAKENPQRHIADRIAGELAELYAQTGAKAQLAALIEATKDRELAGETRDRVHHATLRFGAEVIRGRGGSGTCGASALTGLLAEIRPNAPAPPILKDNDKLLQLGLVPGPEGHSLRQLAGLADAAGFPMRAIRRDAPEAAKARPATDWPVPAIIHWTRGHYSALIKRVGSQYLLRDLALGGDRYISAEALREETSGFALVEDKPLPKGWKDATWTEAEKVFGATTVDNPEDPGCPPESGTGDCQSCKQMPVFDFRLYKGTLRIKDAPVYYSPSRGPEMAFTLTYSQDDPHDVTGVTYGNVGPNWSWSAFSGEGLSYAEIGMNGTDVNIYMPGGVIEGFEGVLGAKASFDYGWSCPVPDPPTSGVAYNGTETYVVDDLEAAAFTPKQNFYTRATLNRTQQPTYAALLPVPPAAQWPPAETLDLSAWVSFPLLVCPCAAPIWTPNLTLFKRNLPAIFERVETDGTRETYGLKVNNRYLLTQITYPDGGIVTFVYGNDAVLDSITDADGNSTVFSYENAAFPKRITKVTIPFGRSASLEYENAAGRLIAITDAGGMRSSFEYKLNSTFIQKMTTPYGDTTFTYDRPAEGIRALEATDPMGGKQRLELRLGSAKTLYWDQRAMRDAPLDEAAAHIYTWAASATNSLQLRPIVLSEKHPLENPITYTYEGQPVGNSSAAGIRSEPATVTRTVPDQNGVEAQQITQTQYDSLGHAIKVTDPKGRVTEYEYDEDHEDQLVSVRQFIDGATPHHDTLAQYLNYHAISDQPEQIIDAAGKTTDYAYDALGRVTGITRHRTVGGVVVNEATTYTYHPTTKRLTSITAPGNAVTGYTYDSVGRIRTVTNSENYTVTYDYDNLDRMVKATYPDGTYEQTIYNRLDAEWQRDRAGRWTRTTHNANREVTSVTDPAGRTTQFQRCDGCGALEGIVDAEQNRTSFAFDVAGRLTKKEYADGKGLVYEYEVSTSRLATMTDAKQQVTRYSYNVDNTLAAVSYTTAAGQPLNPPTPGVSYSYDPYYKRLKTMTDQFGVTDFGYYPAGVLGAGRVQFDDGPEGPNNEAATAPDIDKVIHTYDEYGRELSSSLNGVAEARTFDALGRVATVTNPLTNPLGAFAYTYASAVSGRVAQVTYPGGHKAEYGYHPLLPGTSPAYPGNKDLRLSQIKNTRKENYGGGYVFDRVASQFNYGYDKAGNIASWFQSVDISGYSGQVWQFGYDAADQLIGAAVKSGYGGGGYVDGTIQQQYGYGYDDAGNRVTEQQAVRQTNGSYTTTLTSGTHNELNQLTSRTGGSGQMILEGVVNEPSTVTVGGQPAQTWGLGNGQYGWRGTAQVNSGTNSVPIVARDSSYTGADAQNIAEHQTTRNAQVQAGGVAIPSLAYDFNGNLITETRQTGPQRTFQWDAANRLVKIIDGATTTEWKYSGRGQRMEEKVNGVVTAKWRWDGLQMREMIVPTGLTTSSLRRYYAHGMQWTPNTAQPNTTTNYYFFRDHLGSPREMMDASGALHKRYAYDPWGRRTLTANNASAPEPMLGFTGHFYHASTGLHLAFYRAYSAELGRWLSRDPLGDAELEEGPNLYAYVGGNPGLYVDPDGRFLGFGKCAAIAKKHAKRIQALPKCKCPTDVPFGPYMSASQKAKIQKEWEDFDSCTRENEKKLAEILKDLVNELAAANCATASVTAMPGSASTIPALLKNLQKLF